ncbi:M20 family metallopeptidase [Komagataeibacter sp. FNDCF1]|uniref:M20 family metallopeptidase n=1 Tax=Komagataeibacter sp. FNDCF1 TaxID=2878681 RepID=UPI001E41BD41|nr:M20 family metallopeptidase [Komagataeibacter sp. FNDCF1]MCE2563247.1 M20 family metallopeptidase [Komagataeibacter sp. FNDCF1]
MTQTPDLERMKHDLAALIAMPSENPPGHEAQVADYVAARLEPLGFVITRDEYAPGRVNIEARLDNGAGPVFALNTHMDVVPAGTGWTHDPFVMTEVDGRLYGRGSGDCKGSLVCMMEAGRMLAAERDRWRGTLLLVFVADEEVASEGARRYVKTAPHIDFVIVGEPTANTTYAAHKGSLRPLVRVHGTPAHSGTPDLGDNAIYRAAALVNMVAAEHAQVVRHIEHPLVGAASLTITRVSGGHADNVVPQACDLLLDRRMVPGEDEDAVRAGITDLLARANAQEGVRAEILEFRPTTGGAVETPAGHAIVRKSLEVCRANGVADPGPFGFQGACDLVHFCNAGAAGVVIGPGVLEVAHKADEYVPEADLPVAAAIYRDMIIAMMGA